LLVVLPWSAFWERNYFAEAWPALQPLLTNNFVRGGITGLGLVNLCAGFADLALVFAARTPNGAARQDVSLRDGNGPCLVTDRRRLCPGAASFEAERRCLAVQIGRAVEAGIDVIQLRERDLEARDLAVLVADAVRAARGTATRVVVNDRLDVAMACDADGVHLRGDSVSVAEARRLSALAARPWLVGRSVRTVDEAVAAAGADYLIAGTVFPTASKPAEVRLLGLEGLRRIVNATPIPVLAIGGVTADRVAEVIETGAAGVAGIGLFIDSLKPAS
jgi:thiamine-phosphate pyrophosphorylase